MKRSELEPFIAFHAEGLVLEDAVDSLKHGFRAVFSLAREEDYIPLRDVRRKSKKHSVLYRMIYKVAASNWIVIDEVWFLGYNVSSSAGAKARFEFREEDDWRPFRETPEGTVIEMLLMELDEQGQPVNQEERDRLEKAELKGGSLCRHAAILCKDPAFHAFVALRMNLGEATELDATRFIYNRCGIDSRRLLDHDEKAAALYIEYVRRPFIRWSATRGGAAA